MTESEEQASYLEAFSGNHLFGIEWGDPQADHPLPTILEEWLMPCIGPETVAVEIGSGGGRWTRFMHAAKLLYSVDATPKSEELVRREFARLNDELLQDSMERIVNRLEAGETSGLATIMRAAADELQQREDWRACKNVRFLLADSSGALPEIPDASVDYIFSFDTLVHFERATFAAYLDEFARVLKAGGVVHLHHAAKCGESIGKEFRYFEDGEIDNMLADRGIVVTKELMIPKGYGSRIIEARKA